VLEATSHLGEFYSFNASVGIIVSTEDKIKDNITDSDPLDDLIDPDAPKEEAQFKHSLDHERAIIKAAVDYPEMAAAFCDISASAFTHKTHQWMCKTITKYWENYKALPSKPWLIDKAKVEIDDLVMRGEVQTTLDSYPEAAYATLECLLTEVREFAGRALILKAQFKYHEDLKNGVTNFAPILKAAQDGMRICVGEDNPYAADLRKRGIPFTHDLESKALLVDVCPCCGLPGVFCYSKDDLNYKCAVGKRSWLEGRGLWKAHKMDDGFHKLAAVLESPDPEWLIDYFLPRGKISAIYAPPGTYKSVWELDRAMSVAYGILFQGKYEVNQGKVVYLYSEGADGLKRRVKAWLLDHGISEDDPRSENIVFHFKRHDLSCEIKVEKLCEMIEEKFGKPDLLVIDTLAKNFKGGENEEMQKMVDACEDIRDILGCAVDIIHHSGKDVSRGLRGGSQLAAGIDMIFELVKEGDDAVKVVPKKIKDGRPLKPFMLEIKEYVFSDRKHDHSIVLVVSDKPVPVEPDKQDPAVNKFKMAMLDCIELWQYVPGSTEDYMSKAEIIERHEKHVNLRIQTGDTKARVMPGYRTKDTWKILEHVNLISKDDPKKGTRAKIRKQTDAEVDFFTSYTIATVTNALSRKDLQNDSES
jgi:AAA domain